MIRKYLSKLPQGRHFWFLMSNLAVTGLASTMLSPFLPLFLYHQLRISVGAVSLLYFVSGLVGTITVVLVGWLIDRIGRRKVYVFGDSSSAVIPAALSLTTTFNQALPVISLSGVMDAASRTSQTTIIADQVEEGKRTTAYGISRIVANCSWIVAPILGGAILAASNNFQALFLTSSLLGITALALAPTFYWLLLAVVVMTLGENMFFPIASTMVTEISPESERGMYVGVLNLFLSLGANISPLLGGTIWQLTGNASLPWLLSPLYAAVSIVLAAIFKMGARESVRHGIGQRRGNKQVP